MATPQQRSRVESLLGIRMPKRPTPMARKPAPASEPTPMAPPAPARRAERVEPEAPPAKRAEANTIKAIVVDPQARTVKEAKIRTEAGDERNGYGTQLKQDAVGDIIGSDDFEALDIERSGEVVVVDALQDGQEKFWRLDDEAPVGGIGVVVGYDSEGDAYRDTALTVDEVRASVKWDAGDEDDADPDELRATISERLDGLDARQLRRLTALIDNGALDEDEEAEQ